MRRSNPFSLQEGGLLRFARNDALVDAPPVFTLSFTTSPSAAKSALRGEVRRNTRPMLRPGCGFSRRRNLTSDVAPLDVGRDLRNQRDAVAARDHLHHRVQAAGAEHGAAALRHGSASLWRRTPAPGRAGSGRPRAGSAGSGRCLQRRPARSPCADRRSPAPPAGTDPRTGPSYRCRARPPAKPASRHRARRS